MGLAEEWRGLSSGLSLQEETRLCPPAPWTVPPAPQADTHKARESSRWHPSSTWGSSPSSTAVPAAHPDCGPVTLPPSKPRAGWGASWKR